MGYTGYITPVYGKLFTLEQACEVFLNKPGDINAITEYCTKNNLTIKQLPHEPNFCIGVALPPIQVGCSTWVKHDTNVIIPGYGNNMSLTNFIKEWANVMINLTKLWDDVPEHIKVLFTDRVMSFLLQDECMCCS